MRDFNEKKNISLKMRKSLQKFKFVNERYRDYPAKARPSARKFVRPLDFQIS